MMKKKLSNFFLLLLTFFIPFALFSESEVPHSSSENLKEESLPDDYYSLDPYFDHYQNENRVDNHLKEGDNFQAKFLNMLFILSLLIGFMILASWLLKRMMKARITQINQASYIKVLETRQLSPKSTLYFIEIEEERVLVGESQAGLHLIAAFRSNIEISGENHRDRN